MKKGQPLGADTDGNLYFRLGSDSGTQAADRNNPCCAAPVCLQHSLTGSCQVYIFFPESGILKKHCCVNEGRA